MGRGDPKAIQAFAISVLEFMRTKSTESSLFDRFIATVNRPLTERQAAMVVADLVEWTQDLAGDDLVAIDERLAKGGSPTLSLMRRRQDREFGALLSTGKITTDDEWRLVEARMSDTENPLPDRDRALANRMLVSYESERNV